MAESSAWMRAELDPQAEPTRKRNRRGTPLFAISTTFAPSSSVILVSTLTTREISQIAKGNDGRDDRHHAKGDDDPRRGQNCSPSPGPHGRTRMIVFPLRRSVRLKVVTA